MTVAKIPYAATAMLWIASAAHADFTATVKCGAKGSPTQSYVAIAPTYLGAIKSAIAKAEEAWPEDACYSVDVTPKPHPMFDCNTKYCPPAPRRL